MSTEIGSRVKQFTRHDFDDAWADITAAEQVYHAVRHRLGLMVRQSLIQNKISVYDLKKIGKANNICDVLNGKKWSGNMVQEIIHYILETYTANATNTVRSS